MRIVAITVMLAIAAPAAAQVHSAVAGPVRYYSPAEFQMMYRYQLKLLRDDLLRQRKADGGVLSAASLSRYQARRDKLNAGFQRSVRNNDPLSVDGFGHAVDR